MALILTLVAPMDGRIDAADIAGALAAHDLAITKTDWLAPNEACDFYLATDDRARAESLLAQALAGQRIDWLVQADDAGGRRKRLLLADMESTLIEQELLDEMAAMAGVGDKISAITARAMNGELDFKAALAERVAMLKGFPASAIDALIGQIRLMPGAADLVTTLKAANVPCYIATGGFSCFAEKVSAQLGCDGFFANRLEIKDGALTGRVLPPVLDKSAKLATLEDLARRHGLAVDETAAIGDGANDLDMLKAAGLGLGFRPKPVLAAALGQKVIRYSDLSAMLYFQGIQKLSK